jgi:hypothetical protein
MASTFRARSTRLCCRRSEAGNPAAEDLGEEPEPIAREGRLPDRDARSAERDRRGFGLGGHHDGRGGVAPDALHLDVGGVADDHDAVAARRMVADQVLHPQHVGTRGIHAGDALTRARTALHGPDPVRSDDDDAPRHLGHAAYRHHAPSAIVLHHPRVVDERAEGVHGLARVVGERALHDRERPLHAAAGPERRCPEDSHEGKVPARGRGIKASPASN